METAPIKPRERVTQEIAELRRLQTLLDISRSLMDTLHLQDSLQQVVGILEDHPAVLSAYIRLQIDEATSVELPVLTPENLSRQVGYLGEKLIAKVADSGKPIVVPRTSLEPLWQSRKTARRHESTFLGVPVREGTRSGGVLALQLAYDPDRSYERALNFAQVVASMVAQALKISRLATQERRHLLEENLHLREELRSLYDFSNIIGNSSAMREVYERIAQVARTNTTVLIRGESGTGKELIAQAIHYNSLHADKPFVRVSCGALPETPIEAELFGYEKGAFTGAEQRKKGRFELADGGTIFLDEIGELTPAMQVKLLRVLQEREFERVGGTETIRVNVRVLAATNKDLEKGIAAGSFREDLYYRLNVFAIYVPPLRERKADILLLADHFLEKYARKHGKVIRRISTPAIDMLSSYHWPGNVRELENAMERAVLVCEGNVIHGHHLPPSLQTAEASGTLPRLTLSEAVASYEKDLIQDALKSTRGNRAKAARLLGTTERIIGYKVKKYGIDCSRFP